MPLPSVRANADLASAARRIVGGSLGIATGERVLVVHDRAHAELAQPLCEAIAESGAEPLRLVLEDLAPRPHAHVEPKLLDALKVAQTPEVTFELSASNKPAVIKAGTDFLYVLMPVDLG